MVERERARFDNLDQLGQRGVRILADVGRVIVSARIRFKVFEVQDLVGEVRLYKDIDVEIDVTKNLPIKIRWHTHVAIEAIAEAKNVVPPIEPIIFSTDSSRGDRPNQSVFDVFVEHRVKYQ